MELARALELCSHTTKQVAGSYEQNDPEGDALDEAAATLRRWKPFIEAALALHEAVPGLPPLGWSQTSIDVMNRFLSAYEVIRVDLSITPAAQSAVTQTTVKKMESIFTTTAHAVGTGPPKHSARKTRRVEGERDA